MQSRLGNHRSEEGRAHLDVVHRLSGRFISSHPSYSAHLSAPVPIRVLPSLAVGD